MRNVEATIVSRTKETRYDLVQQQKPDFLTISEDARSHAFSGFCKLHRHIDIFVFRRISHWLCHPADMHTLNPKYFQSISIMIVENV